MKRTKCPTNSKYTVITFHLMHLKLLLSLGLNPKFYNKARNLYLSPKLCHHDVVGTEDRRNEKNEGEEVESKGEGREKQTGKIDVLFLLVLLILAIFINRKNSIFNSMTPSDNKAHRKTKDIIKNTGRHTWACVYILSMARTAQQYCFKE